MLISEDCFSIKEVAPPQYEKSAAAPFLVLGSCFYDDSIFILKVDLSQFYWLERYFILQDRWTKLCPIPIGYLASCIGLDQKIIISSTTPGLLVYDIILNNYCHICNDIFDNMQGKVLIKNAGKLYLISCSTPYRMYSCDGVFFKWNFLFESTRWIWPYSFYRVAHEGFIYTLSGLALYEFDLKKLKSNYRVLSSEFS